MYSRLVCDYHGQVSCTVEKKTNKRCTKIMLLLILITKMINNNQNYQLGHRQRIFNNILDRGIDKFTTIEIIELCLFLVIPRKNVKPLAYRLYDKYNYLYLILGASKEDIMSVEGVGLNVYIFFQTLLKIIQTIQEEQVYEKEYFCNLEDIVSYCKWKMSFLSYEQLRVLYFNNQNKLIRDEVQGIGTLNEVSIHPREIIRRCLELGAGGIVLCHNHPSGDPTPSKEDKAATIALKKITDSLQIYLYDHIIIGENRYISMKKIGILKSN